MSEERKAHIEALQMAIEVEKKGYRFYKIAAKSTQDEKGRQVFEQLAKDEVEHMGVFATLYESLTNDEPWMTYEQAVARFGESGDAGLVFPEVPDEAQEGFDDMKALEEALEFEHKAVRIYKEKAAEADDELARTFYEKLVEIEESHVMIIQAEIDSLTGSGIWLDYQEISLEH
jgi:rubrerythrin